MFPFEESVDLRRHDETETFANEALQRTEKGERKVDVFGVKHPTVLSKIMPDMIRGMGIDDLHHSYHGVSHKLLELWTLPKYKKMPWSIHSKLALIDDRLQNICLPNYVQCGVRPIGNLSLWKAQHMKIFILYLALPVLEGVLSAVYYDHLSIFVKCLFVLNSTSISPDDLLFCSKQLVVFVKQFQALYGERHMTINVHNTQHLAFVVNNLGPMRCYSCFPLESLNGEMLKMIHGTKYVQLQLANCAYLVMSLQYEISCIKSQILHDFAQNLHHSYQRVKLLAVVSTDTNAAGNYVNKEKVDAEVKVALLARGFDSKLCDFFTKLKRGSILFVAKSYLRSTKTASYLTSYFSDNGICYGIILYFIRVWCSAACGNECKCKPIFLAAIKPVNIRCFSDLGNLKSINHIFRYVVEEQVILIDTSQLKNISFSMNIARKDPFLCERNNWLEIE